MSSKKLFALLLVVFAGIALLEFFPTGGSKGPADITGRPRSELGADAAPPQGLASSDRTGAAADDDAHGTGLAAALAALEIRPATPGATRTIRVEVAWPGGEPAATGPAELNLTALALDEEIRGVELLRALQSNAARAVQRRQLRDLLFQSFMEDRVSEVRAGLLARAPFVAAGNGRWMAELVVPERSGRVHVHVVGAGYYSEKSASVGVTARATTVALARGAFVEVRISTDLAGVDTAETHVRLQESEDGLAAYARGAEGRPALRIDLGLRGNAAGAVTVPAGIPIEIVGRHPTAAVSAGAARTFQPGERRTIEAKLVAGTTLAGRVLAPGASPLTVPAKVLVLRPGSAFGFDDVVLRETETDAGGRFHISGLEGDEFAVLAEADGYREGRSERLRSGAGAPLDDVVVELQFGGSIRGRLVGTGDLSPAEVRVEARFDVGYLVGPASLAAMSGPFASGTSDEEGAFAVAGLGAGPFTVKALDAKGTTLARADNVLPGGEEVVLVLAPPTSVEGIALGEDELALPRLGVTLARVQQGSLGELRMDHRDTSTDELGRFRFEGVEPGTYEIWSRTETHASVEAERIVVDRAGPRETRLAVPRAASAAGVVRGPEGAPLAGARVSVVTDHPAWLPPTLSGPDVESTLTDEEGRFELLGLPPKGTRLQAEKAEYASVESELFDLRPGETRTRMGLVLTRGGTVEGICFDEEGRTAKDRIVTINSMSVSTSRTVRASEDGTFRVTGLRPGTYQLVALDPQSMGSASKSSGSMAELIKNMRMARAEVREGETAFVFLGTPDPAEVRVTGRVTQRGRPAPARLVTWSPASTEIKEGTRSAETDASGEYSLLLDEPGAYFVQVMRVGSGPGLAETLETRARIEPGQSEVRLDVELPAGRISGRVFGPEGAPLSGARVSLLEHGGVPLGTLVGRCYGEITAGGDGRFAFDTVEAGEYFLGVGGSAMLGDTPDAPARVLHGPFLLDADEVLGDVEIRLPEAGSLRIRVLDASGSPVPDAALFLRDASGNRTEHISMATTNGAGVIVLHGLAPGEYTVVARGASLVSAESPPVTVEAGETAALDLLAAPGAAITVKVRGDDSVDLANTRIRILDADGRDVVVGAGPLDLDTPQGTSIDERRFGPFAPGTYRVIATAPSGASASKPVRVGLEEERVALRLR